MKKIALLLIISLLFWRCNQPDQKPSDTESKETLKDTGTSSVDPGLSRNTGCFEQITEHDTVLLHITTEGDKVIGDLQYRLEEKDANTGTLQGIMKGDTLLADYTFQSEGITSVRQVAFLKKETGYVEGFGEIEERNGKTVFNPNKAVQFSDSLLLKKIECR